MGQGPDDARRGSAECWSGSEAGQCGLDLSPPASGFSQDSGSRWARSGCEELSSLWDGERGRRAAVGHRAQPRWREAAHGHPLPSEAVPVLHDLPAGCQQHGGAKGSGQEAQPGPALPRVHLPHHGKPARSPLGGSPGWKVMSGPPLPPRSFLSGGGAEGMQGEGQLYLATLCSPLGQSSTWRPASPSKDGDGTSLTPSQTLPLGLHQAQSGPSWVLTWCSPGEVRRGLAPLGDLLVGEWSRRGPQLFLVPTTSVCDAASLSSWIKAFPPLTPASPWGS